MSVQSQKQIQKFSSSQSLSFLLLKHHNVAHPTNFIEVHILGGGVLSFFIIHCVVKINVLNASHKLCSAETLCHNKLLHFFQRGRPVPVLIPPDCRKPLDFLANTSQRSIAKVVEGNPYLFSKSGMQLLIWLFFKADYCILMNV